MRIASLSLSPNEFGTMTNLQMSVLLWSMSSIVIPPWTRMTVLLISLPVNANAPYHGQRKFSLHLQWWKWVSRCLTNERERDHGLTLTIQNKITKKSQKYSAQDSAQDSDGVGIVSATSSKPAGSSKPRGHKGPSNKARVIPAKYSRTALSSVCCLSSFSSYRIHHNADMPLHCSKQDVFKSQPTSLECSMFTFCVVDYLGMRNPTELKRAVARPLQGPVLFTTVTDCGTRDQTPTPSCCPFWLFPHSENEAGFTYLADKFLESIIPFPAAHPRHSFVSTKRQRMEAQGGLLLSWWV